MNDIYEKIGSGINKIQGTIQSSQSMSQYKKVIQEAVVNRTDIIVQLGEEVYKKLRAREIESENRGSKVAELIDLDRKIYQSQQAIVNLSASEANHLCPSCGVHIAEGDKFCGGCGIKIELKQTAAASALKKCSVCEEMIQETASFCNCCGTKLV
jgi:hypothetical protein